MKIIQVIKGFRMPIANCYVVNAKKLFEYIDDQAARALLYISLLVSVYQVIIIGKKLFWKKDKKTPKSGEKNEKK